MARKSLAPLRVVQRNPALYIAPVVHPSPPESGHYTHLLSLVGGTEDVKPYGEFGFRMTSRDVLKPASSYLPGAGTEGFNLRLRAMDDGDIELERLDLVNIRSIAPRSAFSSQYHDLSTAALHRRRCAAIANWACCYSAARP